MRRMCLVIGLGLVALLAPRVVQGDPIPVVSGFLTTRPADSFATFSLTGFDGSHVEGRWPGGTTGCISCTPGGVADADARFVYDNVPFVFGDPFATGSATIGGVAYPALFFNGTLEFAGDGFLLPEITGPERILEFTTLFTFAATISGFDRLQSGPTEVSPLFTTTWTGAGTARMRFLGVPPPIAPNGAYTWLGTTYEFEPVPEPSTLILAASGLSALIAVRRRRRR